MQTLFDEKPCFPRGFSYFPAFLSNEEETELMNVIEKTELHNLNFHGYMAHRKVASFGYDYSFVNRSLTKGKDIPAEFDHLIKKISITLSLDPTLIAELLVTEYPVGSVINWHRDAPPFDLIAGVSLLSDCTFKLRPQEKINQTRSATLSFPVERKSLYVMNGSARTDWQHSIAPVKTKRYSITFRTLKEIK
jgi:alkylated DNA repair dioxygenase AlkB